MTNLLCVLAFCDCSMAMPMKPEEENCPMKRTQTSRLFSCLAKNACAYACWDNKPCGFGPGIPCYIGIGMGLDGMISLDMIMALKSEIHRQRYLDGKRVSGIEGYHIFAVDAPMQEIFSMENNQIYFSVDGFVSFCRDKKSKVPMDMDGIWKDVFTEIVQWTRESREATDERERKKWKAEADFIEATCHKAQGELYYMSREEANQMRQEMWIDLDRRYPQFSPKQLMKKP